MPTYDYICEKCGKSFEVFQSMKDPRLEKCLDEACDGGMKRKIGTGAGFIFKGSGFYTTDYRSDSYKEAAKTESGAGSGGNGGSGDSKGGGGDSKGNGGSGSGQSSTSSSSTSSSSSGSGSSSSGATSGGSGSASPPSGDS